MTLPDAEASESRTQDASVHGVRERTRTQERPDPPPADPAPAERALAIAYRFISNRERSVAEVRARLERAELAEDEIEAAIAELTEFGYLNDARYAVVFTEDKRTLESWGNDRIARALRERGLDRNLIEAALAESGPADDGQGHADGEGGGELERAVALLLRRFPAGPGDQRDRERAFGVLARKGYESELAGDAVRAWARRTAG